MKKSDFTRILHELLEIQKQRRLRMLHDYWIFKDFSLARLKSVAQDINEKYFCRKEKVYEQGESIDGVYLIKKGEF